MADFRFAPKTGPMIGAGRSPTQQATPAAQIRGAVQGGGVQQPLRTNREAALSGFDVKQNTLDTINQLAQTVLEPAVQEEVNRRFMDGARRQVEGEALLDIVNEQPWYSKIFGPSASAQGARAIAEIRGVEQFTAGLQADMPNLRQLPPSQFGQVLTQRMEQQKTGDPTTDTAVQLRLLENMGTLVTQHTKEHYAYVQESMQGERTGLLLDTANSLNELAGAANRGMLTPEEYERAQTQLVANMGPMEGQGAESYWNSIGNAMELTMQEGNFHLVQAAEAAGLLDAMPAEDRIKFNSRRRELEGQARSDMANGPFAVELARLKAYASEGLTSPRQTMESIAGINARFRNQTGMQADLIDGNATAGILQGNWKGLLQAQRRRREAAADRRSDYLEKVGRLQEYGIAIGMGAGGAVLAQGADRSEVQGAFTGIVRQQMGNDGPWAQTLVNNAVSPGGQLISDAMANSFASQMTLANSPDAEFNEGFLQTFSQWQEIVDTPQGGHAAANLYFGEENSAKMQHFRQLLGTYSEQAAFDLAFRQQTPGTTPSNESREEAFEWISNETSAGWTDTLASFFGGTTALAPNDSGRRVLADQMARILDVQSDNNVALDWDTRAQIAYQSVQPRVDVLGEYVVPKSVNDRPLSGYLGASQAESGIWFTEFVNAKGRLGGIENPVGADVHRLSDVGGQPYFSVELYGDDGELIEFQVSGEEVANYGRLKVEESRDPNVRTEQALPGGL